MSLSSLSSRSISAAARKVNFEKIFVGGAGCPLRNGGRRRQQHVRVARPLGRDPRRRRRRGAARLSRKTSLGRRKRISLANRRRRRRVHFVVTSAVLPRGRRRPHHRSLVGVLGGRNHDDAHVGVSLPVVDPVDAVEAGDLVVEVVAPGRGAGGPQ